MTQAHAEKIQFIRDGRLSASSESTIATVMAKHYKPFRQLHGLEEFIINGHPDRGGQMASFVVDLVKKNLAYSTIKGYIWAVVDAHTRNGYISPLTSVYDWAHFMQGVDVCIGDDKSPQGRKQIPMQMIAAGLAAVDPASRKDLMTAITMLFMLFGVCRVGELLPKTKAAAEKARHLWRDGVLLKETHVEYRAPPIRKNDQRGRRANATDNGEWIPIGRVEKSVFDILPYLVHYLQMGDVPKDGPFLVHDDGEPFTYTQFQAHFRHLFVAGGYSAADAALYASHGFRVAGFNLFRIFAGQKIAVFKGGWLQGHDTAEEGCDSARTYTRPFLNELIAAPAACINKALAEGMILPCMPFDADAGDVEPAPEIQDEAPRDAPVSPADKIKSVSSPHMAALAQQHNITIVVHNSTAKTYKTFKYGGKNYPSMCKAVQAAKTDTSLGMHNAAMAPSPFAQTLMQMYISFIQIDEHSDEAPIHTNMVSRLTLGLTVEDVKRIQRTRPALGGVQQLIAYKKTLVTFKIRIYEARFLPPIDCFAELAHLRAMLLEKHEEIARAFGLDWRHGAACLSDVASVRAQQLLPSV